MTAAFDGGLISSDGGLVLLREAERRLGLADTLAGCIRDRRNQAQVVHALAAMLRFRMLAIACGYEDADDCDALRADPLFKLASGQAPESGRDLCSQPTMSRLGERAVAYRGGTDDGGAGRHLLPLLPSPSRRHHPRHRRHLRSRARPAAAVALPRPLRHPLLPARPRLPRGERQAGGDPPAPRARHLRAPRSAPSSSTWFAASADTGPTPGSSSAETPHYGRPQAMAWCEANGVDYIFGLAGNRALHALAYDVADDLKVRRAEAGADRMRAFTAFAYAARSWRCKRRVVARLEATTRGFDARYIVTSLTGEARHLYEDVYCARGQAENLIKLHKGQLASDRTSCQSPLANQLRLVLHTGAYWLMLALRDAIPPHQCRSPAPSSPPSGCASSRSAPGVVEKAARIRIHFASACPDATLLRLLAGAPRGCRPLSAGAPCPVNPSPFNPQPSHNEPRNTMPDGVANQRAPSIGDHIHNRAMNRSG